MNKTAIKNFAIWARRKLINDITYKAGLLGIDENGISDPLPISTNDIQFFDVGTGKPTEIVNDEIKQRIALVRKIKNKENTSDYITAYEYVIEEVAYTWFNRLIAIRFMEVNEYLPSRIRVLSSEMTGKSEPDIVTNPFETGMDFSAYETDRIIQLKDENSLDELFRMLFVKQCNELYEILPELFERTSDYSELLLNISFTDQEGIVNKLNKLPEGDFTEAVEIIGWMYQYYNEERKNEVINIYKGTVKKEDIPAATQLFTTDWVVRYMVDNSLGRYWIERNPDSKLHELLEFYVTKKEGKEKFVNEKISPEDLTIFDPCMGSGHILVYAFDVLIAIYREYGYQDRDAVQAILENNIFGLDIDERAYQLTYFAVMMKARSYDRRIFTRGISPKVYSIYDYPDQVDTGCEDVNYLISEFENAKQFGSLIKLKSDFNLKNVESYVNDLHGQLSMQSIDVDRVKVLIPVARLLTTKYSVVCTNPPYLNRMNGELKKYITRYYKDYSGDLFSVFMYKNFEFCKTDGYSAFMTPFVWMFIKTYKSLREFIVRSKSITTLIQMEYSAFEEATVPICSFVLKNSIDDSNGTFFKLSAFKGGMEVQKNKVLQALKKDECKYSYETSASNFLKIPGYPIAYWVGNNTFTAYDCKKINDYYIVRNGISTGDNKKYLRRWSEVDFTSNAWKPCNKGGAYRKWYGNNEFFVYWKDNGHEIRTSLDDKGRIKARLGGIEYSFKEGIEMSRITSGALGFRYSPKGFIFESSTNDIYQTNELNDLYSILGYFNSRVVSHFLNLMNPTINIMPEDIRGLPCNDYSNKELVQKLVKSNIEISKSDWDSFETSWDFDKHPLIIGEYISDAYEKWNEVCSSRFSLIKENEEKLNEIYINIYGVGDELESKVDDSEISIREANLKRDVKSFISYAVGCIFGRYALDKKGLIYAGGEWNQSDYNIYLPDGNNCILLTDEEYLEDDIIRRFTEFLCTAYSEKSLEDNLEFIAKALNSRGENSRDIIRNYFLKEFFNDHKKIYQKRPIYWLYDSGKQNGFKALVYMHRYNLDTTGVLRVNYLHKLQKIYTSEIERMQDMIENSTQAREITQAEKRKEKLIKQLKETKEYDEKIAHIALSRIGINLDDGVLVNYEKVQVGQDGKKLNILAKI
jgi:type II restriction/modification system DNA methylase subunit YeeA